MKIHSPFWYSFVKRAGWLSLALFVFILLQVTLPTHVAQAQTPPPDTTDLKAITAALNASVAEHREQSLAYLLYKVQIDHVDFSADRKTAAVWLAFVDPESGQVIATEPGLALGHRSDDGSWTVTLQVEDSFTGALNAVPASLISSEMKSELQPPADQVYSQAGQVFSGYKLPWKGGTNNYVTGSIGHVLTYKSCPTTCMYAFDFANGTMFEIYAARSGRVKYAVWQHPNGNTDNTNYLILEDTSTTPTTYQVYYHLAQNTIPAELRVAGAPVNQGQFIGNADDTGASTGHHLHFHVHTTANAVWGTSVDITFDDVSINGGRPRTCSEASTYPEYGSQCPSGNKLLSGNNAGPLPEAPTALAPSGKQTTPTPTFQWSAVSGATQYALTVTKAGTTTVALNQTVSASACVDGTCSYKPTTALADAQYEFTVRAGGASGWSSYSAPMAFNTSRYPDAPATVSPSGTIYYPNPAYTWNAVEGADRYYLVVYSEKSATNIIYRTVMAADYCRDGVCAYTSTINVKHGPYKFRVRSGNSYGWGVYSVWRPFSAYLVPFLPVLGEPAAGAKVTVQRPIYSWKASATATKYGLRVYSLASKSYVFSSDISATYLCTGEDCWYKPSVNLKAGQYQFRLRAYNSFGWSDYTAWQPFTVQLVPDPPVLVSPAGTSGTLSPAYTWKKVPGATSYYWMVWDNAAAEYIIYRGKAATEVCGEGDTCSYVSTINVEAGKTYKFKVRAYNSFGWSAYSPFMEFTATAP